MDINIHYKNSEKGIQIALNNFLKPDINMSAPAFAIASASKTKNPQVGQAKTIILKSLSGGKLLNLTDRLTVEKNVNHFKKTFILK